LIKVVNKAAKIKATIGDFFVLNSGARNKNSTISPVQFRVNKEDNSILSQSK
jgi:hypothetical protein